MMAWTNSTPAWWKATPRSLQVLLLAVFMPGVLMHEWTHAVVAAPYADVNVVWDAVAVDMHWQPETPRSAVALAHLAPLLVGWVVGAVLVASHVLLEVRLPPLAMAYVVAQWLLYTVPVLGDFNF